MNQTPEYLYDQTFFYKIYYIYFHINTIQNHEIGLWMISPEDKHRDNWEIVLPVRRTCITSARN
jgi:hypothetical protein